MSANYSARQGIPAWLQEVIAAGDDTLLRPIEVATSLRVCRRTVYRWLEVGELTGYLLVGQWRIAQSDLAKFLAARHEHRAGAEHTQENCAGSPLRSNGDKSEKPVDGVHFRVNQLTGCWIWIGRRTKEGYGLTTSGELAHRAHYTLLVGPIPPRHTIDHRCWVPMCVNPEHLEAVTATHNSQSRPVNKLTYQQADQIRQLRDQGLSYSKLAEQFGITQSHVFSIVRGAAWSKRPYRMPRDQDRIRAIRADRHHMTRRQLAAKYHCSFQTIRYYLRRMFDHLDKPLDESNGTLSDSLASL